MKYIKTYEQFLNEKYDAVNEAPDFLSDDVYQVLKTLKNLDPANRDITKVFSKDILGSPVEFIGTDMIVGLPGTLKNNRWVEKALKKGFNGFKVDLLKKWLGSKTDDRLSNQWTIRFVDINQPTK